MLEVPPARTTPGDPTPPVEPAVGTGTLAWAGPFAVFMVWLAIDGALPIANPAKELLRDAVLLAALVGFSRRVVPRTAPHWIGSVLLGIGVAVVWIAPEVLLPAWRNHWLFQNAITGHIALSIPPSELTPLMLLLRSMRAALLVPFLEELFWRGWLPRWLQDTHFQRIPLGRYTPFAFWSTVLLFGAEHGPYWEVGILAGLAYNWWMRRTKSLGDLVLAHAITNLALSMYVIVAQDWKFWM